MFRIYYLVGDDETMSIWTLYSQTDSEDKAWAVWLDCCRENPDSRVKITLEVTAHSN